MFLSKIGTGELILIIVIAIIVFGPDKLPKIARSIGKAFGTAKKYARQVGDELKEYEEEVEDVASTLRDPLGLKKKDSPAKLAEEPGQAQEAPQDFSERESEEFDGVIEADEEEPAAIHGGIEDSITSKESDSVVEGGEEEPVAVPKSSAAPNSERPRQTDGARAAKGGSQAPTDPPGPANGAA